MLRDILIDIKTYLSIRIKNPRRFPGSRIESYVPGGLWIGKACTIKKNVLVTNSLKHIGDFSYIGDGTSIYECSSIGNYCSISHGVKIGLSNHPTDHISTHTLFYEKTGGWVTESTFDEKSEKKCVIENDVLISANAMILNGVTIGTGAVVGAGAFVNKDVPPYAIVAGIPAKIIRYRFDEDSVARLLASKWWELPPKKIKALAAHFASPNDFLKHIERP